jgi:hypothetical protein
MANPDVPRKAAPLHGVGGGLRWPSPSLPLSGERLPVRRASHTDAALQRNVKQVGWHLGTEIGWPRSR